ncbi:hypothetical protein CBM15_04380 [Solibacillus kalamii]|uniref:Cold-shock protein n=1 Tax=Solibacillus kalamii TaxID=1748298 RepID=A0ABX3ZJ41_9BACL|nr:hypothetical protein CBM15_04380 [Solibacillus kalamii]
MTLNKRRLVTIFIKHYCNFEHIVRSGKKLKPGGMMKPTCPHCNFITEGFEFSSEVKKGGN